MKLNTCTKSILLPGWFAGLFLQPTSGEPNMRKAMIVVAATLTCAGLLPSAAGAQGTPQTVDIAKVNVQKLPAGYRASKIIGSSVLNDANVSIGKIDDLLISSDGKSPFAVLSIGGFLGLDSHFVVVSYDSFILVNDKIALPGGTKDMLRMLPEFQYTSK
jgi:PRC-barrel domain protein